MPPRPLVNDTLSAGEAARLLDVDRTTISRWIADGSLKGCGWAGRERTIPVSELDRLVAARQSAAEQRAYAVGYRMGAAVLSNAIAAAVERVRHDVEIAPIATADFQLPGAFLKQITWSPSTTFLKVP